VNVITILGGLVSSVASLVLAAVLVQGPATYFFYWLVPGEKSTDGPIIVVLAYLLAIPLGMLTYVIVWRRRRSNEVAFAVTLAVGPVLMILCAALSAWAAVLPTR
jgi:hypothetical protein